MRRPPSSAALLRSSRCYSFNSLGYPRFGAAFRASFRAALRATFDAVLGVPTMTWTITDDPADAGALGPTQFAVTTNSGWLSVWSGYQSGVTINRERLLGNFWIGDTTSRCDYTMRHSSHGLRWRLSGDSPETLRTASTSKLHDAIADDSGALANRFTRRGVIDAYESSAEL